MVSDAEIVVELQVLVQRVAHSRQIPEREARRVVLRLLSGLCVSERGYGGVEHARRIMAGWGGRGRKR